MKSLYSAGFEFSNVFIVPAKPAPSFARAGIQVKPKNSTLIGIVVLILFLSPPLFAQESAPQGQAEDQESADPASETQASTPTETTNSNLPNDPLAASLMIEIQKGQWTENRAPGPIFNTCFTWEGAVQCYWAIFRMDNLTGQFRKEAYAVHNHLTAEGLEQEFNSLKASPDSLDPYSKAWFLLMTVEFILWAATEELPLSEVIKIFSITDTFTSELFHFIGTNINNPQKKGMDRAGFVFILYAVYNYVFVVNTISNGGFAEPLQTLSNSIQTYFLHRNDGSQVDRSIKTEICSFTKRVGIHQDYLEEKGLLLPGYEEFEERTAREDRNRIKDCEKEYETITFSGEGPGEPKDMVSSFYYANILMLLKISGGDEAVRYFIRHNPVFHKEFTFPDKLFDDIDPNRYSFLILNRMIAHSILKELYEDPEWQMDVELIESDTDRAFISKNIPHFESNILLLFASTEPIVLSRRAAAKE